MSRTAASGPDWGTAIATSVAAALAIVVAVNRIGIATTLVNTLCMATVDGLALALVWRSDWAVGTVAPRADEGASGRSWLDW